MFKGPSHPGLDYSRQGEGHHRKGPAAQLMIEVIKSPHLDQRR